MKAVVEIPEKAIPDTIVRRAIEYLDSSTDYREALPPQQRMRTISRRAQRKSRTDIDDFVLVFVPFLLVAIALLALCCK